MPEKSWEEQLSDQVEQNISDYLESFIEEKVDPAIEGLIADFDPSAGSLEAQFDDLLVSMEEKFDTMVDVQAGKLWTDSQMQVGAANGYGEYVSISEGDEKVCDFCDEMDGEVMDVGEAVNQIEGGDEQEFLSVDDLDDMDTESSGLRPPYHPDCRCTIAFL